MQLLMVLPVRVGLLVVIGAAVNGAACEVGLLVVMGVAVNGAACEGGAASSNGCSC